MHKASQVTKSAVWRLVEGQGDGLDLASTSRSARGRLDFALQVTPEHRGRSSGHIYEALVKSFDLQKKILCAIMAPSTSSAWHSAAL